MLVGAIRPSPRMEGLRGEVRIVLLQLERVHLLAELALALFPGALLRVAPVLRAGGGRSNS